MSDDYEDWLEKKWDDWHDDRHARKANEQHEAKEQQRDPDNVRRLPRPVKRPTR